jgi:hypothetical protein
MLIDIINFINNTIKENAFKKDGFKNSLLLGIAENIPRSNDTNDIIPVVFENGKEMFVELSDKFNLIGFHKINNSTIQPNKNNFGDSNSSLIKSLNCSFIVFFNKKKIDICKEDLDLIISSYFPTSLTPDLKKNLNIQNCYIEPLQSDYNGYALFQREYKTSQFNLKPTHSMFEIKYKIDLTVKKECLNKCSCI